ncbi:tRNA uracil 4-sulfurtransferase ThiI [Paenibacillus mucilaginosus]|uniref:Probable tRNA sulfurtransferase n=1 Tax=Paenibacillus mucilaginosus (strain KNP414) TaxID=1036673 RepID=F8FDR8_PAEMK|nr:tRNA uracil 4-sulfurtransferase ThiI [Paenibacillus mucilaginosus]AEI42633.1 Thiamine biosynthesis [Paenibacillus mucilaginosus KNP414]MCG7214022.1 tRNA 4-thiouridine(8) synthase ThiI [Paenibacillus mucilaginosus]WDM26022.1 tRNA 4-thiouridine(8) synthase ThiI [Paenibacillus mucilaginosus]
MIQWQKVILKLGELVLKGRNRHRFEKTVYEQVKRVLAPWPGITYRREFGRIVLTLGTVPYEDIRPRLAKVLGLGSFSPAVTCGLSLKEVQEASLQVMAALGDTPRTFKVNVRRVNKQFPHDSQEMNRLVGGPILRAYPSLRVDVHHPDAELRIELREEEALIYCVSDEGAGGFPLGSNGRAMLMLSGGIDSPVAGFLALRQGLKVEAVHFHSYPFTSEKSQEKVKDLARKLCPYAGPVKLHMVPFTSVQTRIHEAYRDNLLITILRRTMLRITERLAELHGAGAIVTGESLGQVASQTLSSMNAIGRVVELPMIRPLVCMEKAEIIRIAERIDTYETSILPYEDCCTLFLPPSPSTNPNLKVIQSIERNLVWLEEEIDKAVGATETILITEEDAEQDRYSSLF